jgi:hypothetical protein
LNLYCYARIQLGFIDLFIIESKDKSTNL